MAVTSSFSIAAGFLSATGDNLANNITISRNKAGKILVNGGAVTLTGGGVDVLDGGLGDNIVIQGLAFADPFAF